MDFVFDALSTGRRIKCLTVVDDFTNEAVGILVDHGISGFRVTRALDEMARFRGYPTAIRTDQGPEFTGKALDQWACQRDIKLADSAWQTHTECVHRVLQRQVSRRMPE